MNNMTHTVRVIDCDSYICEFICAVIFERIWEMTNFILIVTFSQFKYLPFISHFKNFRKNRQIKKYIALNF